MSKLIISFDREFQVWSYNVAHGELLLRSPKAAGHSTRIDVLFKDVRALELRAHIPKLRIEEAEPHDLSERPTKPLVIMENGHKIYLIKGADWEGCIIAGGVFYHEDEGEYGQPSVLLSGGR